MKNLNIAKDQLELALNEIKTTRTVDQGELLYNYISEALRQVKLFAIHDVVGSALLKDLLDCSEEVIAINGLRFTGIHEEKIKQVFDKHGIKNEIPF